MDNQTTKPNILIVDDNLENIDVLVGILKNEFRIRVAKDGETALKTIISRNPPEIVLLDIMMPGIDGYQVCNKLKQYEATKDIPVIFVTALDAVQEETKGLELGAVDYIRKPVDPAVVKARIRTHLALKNTRAELKQLLNKTLSGSIKVLIDILSMSKPNAYSKVTIMQRHVKQIVKALKLKEAWQFELAAMLSHIGFITLPDNLIEKINKSKVLSFKENEAYMKFPQIGYELIIKIPRLKTVAEMVKNQLLTYSKIKGNQPLLQSKPEILGAHILKIVSDYTQLTAQGLAPGMAIKKMSEHAMNYEPTLVTKFREILHIETTSCEIKEIKPSDICEGMIVDEDIFFNPSMLLVAKGTEVSTSILSRLRMMEQASALNRPIRVLIPTDLEPETTD